MAIANSRKDVLRYVLKADRLLPVEQQTVFLTRPLSSVQLSTIEGMVDFQHATGMARAQVGHQRQTALKLGLIGWERFCDEQGKEVPFVQEPGSELVHGVRCTNPPTEDTLALLQKDDWAELADWIRTGSKLTVGDVGG